MSSLKANALWMIAGRIIYAACQWLVIIGIARFLGAEQVGHFSYAMAFCAPVYIFLQMNMRMYLATDSSNEFDIGSYITTRRLFATLAAVLCLIFFYTGDNTITVLFLCIVLFKAVESNSDIYYGCWQKHEVMKHVGVSLALRGLSSVMGIVIGLYLYNSINLMAAIILAGWLLTLVLYDMRFDAHKGNSAAARFTPHSVIKIVKKCWPLAFVMSIGTLNVNAPIYMLDHFLGAESVGIYSSIAYFFFMGRLVVDSITHAGASRLATHFHQNRAQFNKLFVQLLLVILSLGLVGIAGSWVLGDWLLALIYGDELSATGSLFVWVMCAGAASYLSQLFSVSLTVARRFIDMLLVNIVCLVAAFFSASLLIKDHGITGAGMALFVTMLCMLCLNAVLYIRRIKMLKQAGDIEYARESTNGSA